LNRRIRDTAQFGAQVTRVPLLEPHAPQLVLVVWEETCQPDGHAVPHRLNELPVGTGAHVCRVPLLDPHAPQLVLQVLLDA